MSTDVFVTLKTALDIAFGYWWIYLPVLLVAILYQSWRRYIREKYILDLKWVMLEIKPPADVEKSPKIAESIFAGLHATQFSPSPKSQFFFGVVPNWFSFEMTGTAGEMHFYVRTIEGLRNLVEAEIFGQYPDAEIRVVDDYTLNLPPDVPNAEYDFSGSELIFTKEDAYPIKTYTYFEEKLSKGDSRLIDPLAPLAEVMGLLQPGEHIWIQYLVKPVGDDWVKTGQAVLDKLTGKVSKTNEPLVIKLISGVFKLFTEGLQILFGLLGGAEPAAPAKEEKPPEFTMGKLTTGQKNVLDAVENKLSKLGFEVGIRIMYVYRRERQDRSRMATVIGVFKQLYANNMNSFKPSPYAPTLAKGFLYQLFPSDKGFGAAKKEAKLKPRFYDNYIKRNLAAKSVILCTEELATLWHLPGLEVQAPSIARVESKKSEPPLTLPR